AVPTRGPRRRRPPRDLRRVLPVRARAPRGAGVMLTGAQVEVPADAESFYELSLAEGWGDGAPLLPPTDDAIEALLACTPDRADHVLGVLPPQYGVATIELVA